MASVPAHMDGGDPVRLAVENDLETHFETSIRVTLSCWRPLPGAHPPARRAQAKVVSGNERQPRQWGGGRSCPPDGTSTSQQNHIREGHSVSGRRTTWSAESRLQSHCRLAADKVSLGGLVPHVSSSQSRRGEPHRRPAFGVAPPRWGHTRGTPCLLALCSRLMAPRRKAAPGEGTENRQVGPGFPQGCREGVC